MKTAKFCTYRHLKQILESFSEEELDERISFDGKFGDSSSIIGKFHEDKIDIVTNTHNTKEIL